MKITCPICKRITTWEENPFRPFCSQRCKLIDLGKWASEDYRVEGSEPAEPANEPTNEPAKQEEEQEQGDRGKKGSEKGREGA